MSFHNIEENLFHSILKDIGKFQSFQPDKISQNRLLANRDW